MLRAPSPSWSSVCEAFLEETAEVADQEQQPMQSRMGHQFGFLSHEHELESLQLRALSLAPPILESSSRKKRSRWAAGLFSAFTPQTGLIKRQVSKQLCLDPPHFLWTTSKQPCSRSFFFIQCKPNCMLSRDPAGVAFRLLFSHEQLFPNGRACRQKSRALLGVWHKDLFCTFPQYSRNGAILR